MYPEFVAIYICLAVIILMLALIIFILLKIKSNNDITINATKDSNHAHSVHVTGNTAFCKKCATQFDASERCCPKCGTPR